MRFTGHHPIGRTTLVEVIELPPSAASVVRRDAGASGVQVAAQPAVARSTATSSPRRSITRPGGEERRTGALVRR